MNKKLLIGMITVIVVFVIVSMILPMIVGETSDEDVSIWGILIFFASNFIQLIPLVVWIYLVWVVRKKKTNLFDDQMEPKLAERRYKKLKKSLLVAGISLLVGIVGVILHNVIYGLSGIEETVSFFIAISALWVFFIATIVGLVIYLKGRRKTR